MVYSEILAFNYTLFLIETFLSIILWIYIWLLFMVIEYWDYYYLNTQLRIMGLARCIRIFGSVSPWFQLGTRIPGLVSGFLSHEYPKFHDYWNIHLQSIRVYSIRYSYKLCTCLSVWEYAVSTSQSDRFCLEHTTDPDGFASNDRQSCVEA